MIESNISIKQNTKFKTANLGCFLRLPLTRHNMAYASLLCRAQMNATLFYPTVTGQTKRLQELYSIKFEASPQLFGKDLIIAYYIDFIEPKEILDPDYNYDQIVSTFARLVLNPSFDEELIELTKRQLADNYQALMAEPANYALQGFFNIWYASQPDYAESFMGPLDLIEEATPRSLRRYAENLRSVPMVVLGNVYDYRQVQRLADKYFKQSGLIRDFKEKDLAISAPHLDVEKIEKKGNIQSQLLIGYGYKKEFNLKEQVTGLVLSQYLTGEQSSRLFTKVREQTGAAYAIESSWFSNNSLFLINAGLDPDKVDITRKIIIDEMKKVAEGRIDPGLLKQSKQSLINLNLIGQDRENWLIGQQLRSYLFDGYKDFDRIQAIKNVTTKKLSDFVNDLFLNESYILK